MDCTIQRQRVFVRESVYGFALYGAKSYKIVATQATWTGAYNAPHYQVAGAAAWNNGETNTISCYVRGSGTWHIVFEDSGENLRFGQSVVLSNSWQRVVISAANSLGYNYYETRISVFSVSAGTIYIDGVQIEKKSYATPYCDGSLGSGHAWSGTAHASTSSRTAAQISYTQALSASAGTVMLWWRPDAYNSAPNGNYVIWAGSNYTDLSILGSGLILIGGQSASVSAAPNTWVHIAITWQGTAAAIYKDGAQIATLTISPISLAATMTAGRTSYPSNGLIDEFVILDYAADPKLIRAIYESDAPVFVESSVFHWRSPSRVPIWVDEFGLWARGVSGNEILGLYGGDPRNPTGNVTRSWGGITMEENDVVIGRAAQAAVHWDDSVGSLLIGRSSASNLLLSGGAAQMRDSSTVWGSWSSSGLVIGRVANSASRIEITSSGNVNIINRSSGGVDSTVISLASSGNASFTGSITATSGTVGNWAIGSNLSATNLVLTPGAANTANITAGTGSTAGGINSANAGGDIVFWAGSTHANRASAPFFVTAGGALTATNATITGAITASSGSITGALTIGTSGGIYQGSGSFASPTTGLKIWNDGGVGRIAGYNAGTVQWYADTSGKLTAGAGDVVLDAEGVSVLGKKLRIMVNSSTAQGHLYSSNPLDSLLVNSTGIGIQTTGVYSGETVQLYAKSSTSRGAELTVESGTTPTTNRIRAYAYSGTNATSSLMLLDETQFVLAIGNGSVNDLVLTSDGNLTIAGALTVGSVGTWTNITLTSPWQNNGGGWATARYAVFGDWVIIKGLVTPTSNQAENATIATLPASIRPSENRRFGSYAAGTGCALDVLSTGVVRLSVAVNSGQSGSIECMYKK